jgi:hypothetical protein
MAPPIPYGHYAKDPLGGVHKFLSCPSCQLHALLGGGGSGHGLFHHGDGDGQGGSGCGILGHGKGCGHGNSSYVVADGYGGIGYGDPGLIHYGNAGSSPVGTAVVGGYSSGPAVVPTGQTVVQPSGQSICGQPGCGVKSRHAHFGPSLHNNQCGSCGGGGCGACVSGFGHGHGQGTGCDSCGGKGCKNCLSRLGSSVHGKLSSLLHKQRITWFVGPGGPVPLTPGYVPYVVSTRSPRDFFSFAPMNPNDP